MSTPSGAAAPVFSYAQAAKGLTPSTSTQATPRNESPAASEKSIKDRTSTETSNTTSTAKAPRPRNESDDTNTTEPSTIETPAKNLEAKENAPAAQATFPAGQDETSSNIQTGLSGDEPHHEVQKDGARPHLTNGRTQSSELSSESSNDKAPQSPSEKKSKDADDDWEKVPVPSVAAEKELKAAPIPTVNFWQQRIAAQAAQKKDSDQQRGTFSGTGNPPKPKSGNDEFKRKSISRDAGNREGDGKNDDLARANSRKESTTARPSRPSQPDERGAAVKPPPVGDVQSWPTPENSNADERRKSSSYERTDRSDTKGNTQKKWVPVQFVPTAKFETQLPPSAARRGGRGGGRGRDGTGRGGYIPTSGERQDAPGSMGPPPLPKQTGEPDRGRRSEGHRGARGASVPTSSSRPDVEDNNASFHNSAAPFGQEISTVPSPVHYNGGTQAPTTEQSSRSSSRHTGHIGGRTVNGEGNTSTDQASGGYGQHNDPSLRYSYTFDRSKGMGNGPPRNNGEFGRDRGPGKGRDWSRDKPDSAREKVESWRDRESSGDQSTRRETRPERGRGGFRGRGSHTYNPPFGASHAYTSPLPQNGFESSRSTSNGENRSMQSSQPFQPTQAAQSTNNTRTNPRSQSIPVGMMYPGYFNGVPGIPHGMQPIQTDMQVYGYGSQMQMQPGIMSAMPYNDPLNSYALLSMVMTQVEYYFSIDNLCKDLFLRKNMDGQGYVPLTVIGNFKRIKTLTEDNMTLDTLRYVCQQVKSVEFLPGIDGDDRLRRREGWGDFVLPVEERFETARNDGPQHTAEQYHGASQLEQLVPVDPSFGLGHVHSPPLDLSSTNGIFQPNSPMSFVPGTEVDSQVAGGLFIPQTDEAASQVRLPHMQSPPPLSSYVNGHRREASRPDIEGNVFPDENIPNIHIRMQPRHGDPASPPSLARVASNGSSVGPNDDGNHIMSPGQARIPSLRGGAGSPQQLESFRNTSFGPNGIPLADQDSIIYITKDGQETQLPPPQHGQYDQTYLSVHETAFQQRQIGVEGALEPLYSFWCDFLVDKFNLGMYQEFEAYAVSDSQAGSDSGMSHLVRYFGKVLGGPIPISERLASDMVNLSREDKGNDRPLFQTLRAAWRNGATNMKTIKRLGDVLSAEEKAELDKSG